ncbi:MAG: alpha-glucuronidase [Prevotellaceae bacterium]|nr:alpha-glucuronidase [Prevotellaceae bacterium]
MKKHILCLALLLGSACLQTLFAEDGSRLWLRQDNGTQVNVTIPKSSPTLRIAADELRQAWQGKPVKLLLKADKKLKAGAFTLRQTGGEIVISSPTETGLLYGSYHLLRLQATRALSEITETPLTFSPSYDLRLLNHWDNLDRTVERGYAGKSLWEWDELPNQISPRYAEYARANASIGINGAVLNNVNASAQILSPEYLEKVKVLADIFRPYGIHVYLSVNFASPMQLGGLPTADPTDKKVAAWWKQKVNEIYRIIPDFGGFLVKANSEGQPGPQDYGRTHADGANMLADALKPHKGVVMWRAFVYSPDSDDRAKQAYKEFVPLDGEFRSNVIIQIKNGPVDFQPREPFTPLFGAMSHTAQMVEFQITQEYLGFANHVAFLAPMWKECLESDTYCRGSNSTVARVTDGSIYPQQISAIAGVANTGTDANWCGHLLAQANWYAFGRLAWDHELSSEAIVREWVCQTYGTDPHLQALDTLMLASREAVVDYMMPLGLHHIFSFSGHYGPGPWQTMPGGRPDWQPPYYHRADSIGIGFDRTTQGSNAVSQYNEPLASQYNDIRTCPESLLLWFHHVPWTYRMKSGRTLWDELCLHYDAGVKQARHFQTLWDSMQSYIDPERYEAVKHKLIIQTRDAVWWKDACLLYFQTFARQRIPLEVERPIHELKPLMELRFRIGNHENAPLILN